MRMIRTVIILVVVLACLIVAYMYTRNLKPKADPLADTGEVKTITVFKAGPDQISDITIATDKGSVNLYKAGTVWAPKGMEKILLNQSKVTSIFTTVMSLTVDAIVEEKVKDVTPFGFAKPFSTLTVRLKDGKEHIFLVGDRTPVRDSYYFMEKGLDKVYRLSLTSGEMFSSTLDSLRDLSIAGQPTVDQIGYLSILKKNVNSLQLQFDATKNIWNVTAPVAKSVETAAVTPVLDQIATFQLQSFVAENVTNFIEYGLDSPSSVVEVKDKAGKGFKLLLGKEKDPGTLYAKLEGSNTVYTVDKTKISFQDTTPDSLVVPVQ